MAIATIGKIYSVDQVQVQIIDCASPCLIVHAHGRTTTTGWSDGELAQHIYIQPPADGVQGFDFIAKMPSGPVLDVLTPISAHVELPDVDIANYWGKGRPLKGVRIHAVSNAKTVEIKGRKETKEMAARMSPAATAAYVGTPTADEVPGFEEDIKPLFRDRDVTVMEAVAGFNLHKYEDVKANAEGILNRLKVDMPCDGLWPQSDIDKFAAWKDGGMPA